MRLDTLEHINRLIIYFFYDKDGIVDRYVPYMLEDLNKNCSELFIVCNGKLTPEGREIFKKITPNIFVRENIGFDVWAYKESLEYYGWDRLSQFHEIIMINSTIMGPVYPFSSTFEKMNEQDVDFWGLTKFHEVPYDPFGTISYGYIPEHLQSHFIAVRNPMIKSLEFQEYWRKRPEIKSYNDAIGKHEAIFTKYFHDIGFRWSCYVDTNSEDKFVDYPLLFMPTTLIKEYRCPVFKRRSFFHDYAYFLNASQGDEGRKLLTYLSEETDYDVSMIWENILRTSHMIDIKNALGLNYVLPVNYTTDSSLGKHNIALVIHSYFDDLIPYCYHYALSMPQYSDIYITTDTEEKKKLIEETFLSGPWKSVTVLLIKNRGRDISALLVGAAPYLDDYEYVCFMHDKKVTQLDLGIKGYDFSERCFQNLLGSKELVQNIIKHFEKNPHLGMLCPPPPMHADYYPTLGIEWGPNFELSKAQFDKLKLNVPISREKEPVAPLGTMFWFRKDALDKLLSINWKYDDFPDEPIYTDGTLLHAIERLYPFVVQDAGYYVAWVNSDEYMRTEWANLSYFLRETNRRLFGMFGPNNHCGMMATIGNLAYDSKEQMKVIRRLAFKNKIKRKIPKKLWNKLKFIYHKLGGKKWVG